MAGNVTLDVPRTRFVVVHYHIFKNGGSTIESILRREFGTGFTMLHGPGPNSILSGDDLGAFLRDYEVSAISSHHLRYPLPALPCTVIFPGIPDRAAAAAKLPPWPEEIPSLIRPASYLLPRPAVELEQA
jgi:hypothetical protein